MTSESVSPRVSIVILVGDQRARAETCLESVLAQEGLEAAEVVLVECGRKARPSLRGSDHRVVRIIDAPRPLSSGRIRAHAVAEARAPIVAFLEEHVRVEPDWLHHVLEAHRSDAAAIGAVMICGNPGEGVSDAIHLMNYAQYLPSSPLREDLEMLEGHNCTYKRDVLLAYGDELTLLMSNEPLLHWRLRRDGSTIQLNPKIRVHHRNETRLRDICRGYFLWSLQFGDSRAAIQDFSWWKRFVYVAGTPFVPFIRAARLGRLAHRLESPPLQRTLVRFLPHILLAQLASALGQAVGLVFGPLRSEPAFLDYEVNVARGILDPGRE